MTTEFTFGPVGPDAFLGPLIGLAFAAVGIALGWSCLRGPFPRIVGWFAIAVGSLALILGLAVWADELLDYLTLKQAIQDNRVEVVSGCVTAFRPSTSEGHTPDVIRLGRRQISYADNVFSFGFHTTEISGGPIHADSRVRMVLVGDTIVRLDVEQHVCDSAKQS